MDETLQELYQDLILDHARNPRNFGYCQHQTHTFEAYNPLCGDRIVLSLQIRHDQIEQAYFTGEGCAICMASVSLMTEKITQQSLDEVEQLFEDFINLLTDASLTNKALQDCEQRLGKLAVLRAVQAFPMRVKCATLGWHALKKSCFEKSV